jgi:hypothetical protein
VIGIPEKSSDRRGTHQHSTWGKKSHELPNEAAVILHALQYLVAVDYVKLARTRRHRGEGRLLRYPPKLHGLGDGSVGDVVTYGLATELLQPDGENAVHAPIVQNPLALRPVAPEQHSLAPEEMTKTPLEIERLRALPIKPGEVLPIIIRCQ